MTAVDAALDDAASENKMQSVDLENGGVPSSGPFGTGAEDSSKGGAYTLQLVNVKYSINIKKGKEQMEKTLIQPTSLRIRPREMLAIMGASGAGKSTMLDILAGRITPDQYEGSYLLNGKPIDSSFKRVSGYVMQDDALFPLLSVRETLRYAALLRIPKQSQAEKWRIVEETIVALKLTNAADTIVGDERTRGVSGGEKRRVSIGVDIVHQPAIIFLDEPTSGLDSTTALQIVETLLEICKRDRTIAMTIHQPSMRVFNCFNKIMFLSRGYLVYNDSPAVLPDYIRTVSKEQPPAFTNLPEYFLEIIDKHEAADSVVELSQKHAESQRERQRSATNIDPNDQSSTLASEYANDAFTETMFLSGRALKNTIRTPELFFARMGLSVMMGLIIGSLFFNASGSTDVGIAKRSSYFAFAEALFFFTSMEALPLFLNEKTIFTREHSRGAYRVGTYCVANFIITLPFFFVVALTFCSVSYFLVGLAPSLFIFQVAVIFLVMCVGNAFAVCVSGFVPDALTGNSAGTAVLALFFLFSGFFISANDIPKGWKWFNYLSIFKYPYEGLMKGMLTGPGVKDSETSRWQEEYSVADTNKFVALWVPVLFIIAFRVLFYLVLRIKHTGGRH